MHRKSYGHPAAIILLVSVLIAAHVGLLRFASMSQVPVAVATGVVAVLALKFAWWHLRR